MFVSGCVASAGNGCVEKDRGSWPIFFREEVSNAEELPVRFERGSGSINA